jgi:chromosome segregation ATPase
MFGRTRRKEAERFTQTVITMRTEARALQDVLAALQQQISENHRSLGMMAGDLMGLGDQAATRLGSITAELNEGSRTLAEHGALLDRAAESARTDMGVLLSDLPRAEDSARRMAETLREAGTSATQQASAFEQQVGQLAVQAQQPMRSSTRLRSGCFQTLATSIARANRQWRALPRPGIRRARPSTAC